MSQMMFKVVEVAGRKYQILGYDTYLEIFEVQEVGRNFKTVIGWEEI